MPRISKEQKQSTLNIIGRHVEKYRIMMIIVLIVFFFFILGLIIYWNFDENDVTPFIDNAYLISQIIIGVISLGMMGVLILNKYNKINKLQLAIICHIYAVILMIWSAAMSIIDLKIGMSPIVYLIVAALVSSLFVLEPYFFTLLSLVTFFSIMICHWVNGYDFFDSKYGIENTIYFVIFGILIIVISFRHFNVTIKEYNALKKVEQLTYYDELTSLLNERSYLNKVESINQDISKGHIKPFAVILMDVNNLKATNDQYGHRYGCHLVVRTGQTLKTVFKSSALFHIGGDEFLAIVEGEDYENFEQLLEKCDQTFRYSLIQYEGQELVFSVARGFAKYEEGSKYTDVLQKADDMMYENKKEIKETYNLKGR